MIVCVMPTNKDNTPTIKMRNEKFPIVISVTITSHQLIVYSSIADNGKVAVKFLTIA